ncbi:MAG: peptidase, partial [Prevotella sp.]|nr:peptidase [Prevotella sp.]
MKVKYLYILLLSLLALPMHAQRPNYGKMSSMLRQIAHEQRVNQQRSHKVRSTQSQEVCAFIRIKEDGEQLLRDNHCKILAQYGDIYIASIPLNRLGMLSLDHRVSRIEANRSNSIHTDILANNINALPVYSGYQLPQAYTGKDVV